MKRQIVCRSCTKPAKEYAGEWVNRVYGKALREFRCDLCGQPILEGEQCLAESMGTNHQPYFKWEDSFITKTIETGTA